MLINFDPTKKKKLIKIQVKFIKKIHLKNRHMKNLDEFFV